MTRKFTRFHSTFLAVLMAIPLRAQMTSNILERVLDVRVNAGTSQEGTATAFSLDVDGREYLITAKHVVAALKDRDTIDVFMSNAWSPLKVIIYRCDDPVDIAVLVPPRQLTVDFALPFANMDIQFGQDAFFLGFPYNIQSSALGLNGPYPLPLIKKGVFFGLIALDVGKKASLILLDGYNNPGFSGGPIVYRDLNQPGLILKLAGVISGFKPEVVPAMIQHDIQSPSEASQAAKEQPWKVQRRSDGSYFEFQDSGSFVALNTGIVQGYFIEPAIDLIRKHPIGPVVKTITQNGPVTSQ